MAKNEAKPEVKSERKQRVPVSGPRDILTVLNKDKDYVYRWVKDLPGRLQRFLDAGYEIVVDKPEVGDPSVDRPSRLASATLRNDGTQPLVLMRILRKWYKEDQDAKQRENTSIEELLYGEGLKKPSRDDSWQPSEKEEFTTIKR